MRRSRDSSDDHDPLSRSTTTTTTTRQRGPVDRQTWFRAVPVTWSPISPVLPLYQPPSDTATFPPARGEVSTVARWGRIVRQQPERKGEERCKRGVGGKEKARRTIWRRLRWNGEKEERDDGRRRGERVLRRLDDGHVG